MLPSHTLMSGAPRDYFYSPMAFQAVGPLVLKHSEVLSAPRATSPEPPLTNDNVTWPVQRVLAAATVSLESPYLLQRHDYAGTVIRDPALRTPFSSANGRRDGTHLSPISPNPSMAPPVLVTNFLQATRHPGTPDSIADPTRTKKRLRLTPHRWEQLRPVILALYCKEGKTLSETREILKELHGIMPSEKSCKDMIKVWGFTKNKRRQKPERTQATESIVHAELESGDPKHNHESNDRSDHGAPNINFYNLITDFEVQELPPLPISMSLSTPAPEALRSTRNGYDKANLERIRQRGDKLQIDHDYEGAEGVYRAAHAGYLYLLGPSNACTLSIVRSIAQVCYVQKRFKVAESLLLQTIAGVDDASRKESYEALCCLEELAANLQAQSRYADSEVVLVQLIGRIEKLSQDQPKEMFARCIQPVRFLAGAYRKQGEHAKSEELLIETMEKYQAHGLLKDQTFIDLLEQLRQQVDRRAPSERFESFLLENLAASQDTENEKEIIMVILTSLLKHNQKLNKVDALSLTIGNLVRLLDERICSGHWFTNTNIESGVCLARSYMQLGRYEESEKWFLIVQSRIDITSGVESSGALRNLLRTGDLFHSQGKWDEATSRFRQAKRRAETSEHDLINVVLRAQISLREVTQRIPLPDDKLLARMSIPY